MKKLERYIYITLIIILVGIVCTGVTYIAMNEENNAVTKENMEKEKDNEKENSSQLPNSVKFKEMKTVGNTIVGYFDMVLNNKKTVFKIEYTSEAYQDSFVIIKGKLSNSKEAILIDIAELINNQDMNKSFNENDLKAKITENNFQFIKGEDNKDYMLVMIEAENFSGNPSAYLYAYNDNLELITGDIGNINCGSNKESEAMDIINGETSIEIAEESLKNGYKNNFKFTKEHNNNVNVIIEGNKIYYLKANLVDNNEDNSFGTLEERIYTLKNSKWIYEVKRRFKIVNVAGATC